MRIYLMNKNSFLSLIVVVILALGSWWFFAHTNPNDSSNPTPSPSASVSVSPSVSISPSPSATSKVPAITITSPKANAIVDSPVTVTGRARVFENQFTVQLKDSTGKAVVVEHVHTDAKDAGQFGNYKV